MSKPILTMKGISKVYHTGEMDTYALKDINLTINQGDFISISGPSGSGKSTLLSLLGLLDTPDSGQYFIGDQDVSNLSLTEAAYVRCEKMGFIFQSFNLVDELSLFENVAMPLRYRREKLSEKEIQEKVMHSLSTVDMTHRSAHKPNQLSGGQQQRAAIARALVGSPTLLLIDEATGNLDSKNSDQVMEMFTRLNNEGTTLCMVTHDPRCADMAKRRLDLLDGKLEDSPIVEQVVA
ncbi:ABC transporter ATP-binding protein [Pseudoalteromonas luteoviolacea]|uniref:ABC transporter n=1 Tax=Pseudoalteromonas luteoviolacea H33 TaxID=1365251 RepID=A0A167DRI3_9GAMM|nr:ABC transporter ATP-binding protein [Pseudoalteromonas luteoviolacea]KZN49254.1 ABC transporter [Pseudoalteromonas luteoviolacea H33]KZN74843.1 ABC transporter [Pseudoalteromonas luteoviolacea H33-S]MBQ4878386.1 ABC transporter ATP-binding protein [Pseudoalteromonas luteoviolacea]MBQ4907541.1 ABC transporter ATP-binding protein [Pseudoalteromonas luteoviolacea]